MTKSNHYLFLELCSGGDLRGYLKEKVRLPEVEVQSFMQQIVSGMKYLYQNNIVHRDLKLQNILLTEKSPNAILKIADFGLAKQYDNNDDVFETKCGTPIYMAPEVGKGKYDDKADLWSLGVMLFELVAGVPPFMGRDQ